MIPRTRLRDSSTQDSLAVSPYVRHGEKSGLRLFVCYPTEKKKSIRKIGFFCLGLNHCRPNDRERYSTTCPTRLRASE